jgi:hypothetical protein
MYHRPPYVSRGGFPFKDLVLYIYRSGGAMTINQPFHQFHFPTVSSNTSLSNAWWGFSGRHMMTLEHVTIEATDTTSCMMGFIASESSDINFRLNRADSLFLELSFVDRLFT